MFGNEERDTLISSKSVGVAGYASFLKRKREFLAHFFENELPMDWVQTELFTI